MYTSLLSTIARQMIEQICVIKEIETEKIEDYKIIEAIIENHNLHVGAKSLNLLDLNNNNKGILKVFKANTSYGKLAKKYNYYFMYNLYSGDIHHISSLDKLLPRTFNNSKKYNEVYLQCIVSLIKESLLLTNGYCEKLTKKELQQIAEIDCVKLC